MKHHYIEREWVNALLATFAHLGLNTEKITKDIEGFDNGCLMTGCRLEVSAARKMWHRADELANDPLLGVKIGSSQNYRAIGVLAPVIWHSPNVRIALQNLVKFQTLISESGHYLLDEKHLDDNTCNYLEYIAQPSSVPVNVHQVCAVIVGTIAFIKAISNDRVIVEKVYLPPRLNARLIEKKLACQVISREGNFAICFNTTAFDQPLLSCDPSLYQLNITYAEELLRAKKASIALIDTIKLTIEEGGLSQASIGYVERALGLHKRTLQRHLSEQGTSFRQLKEETLKAQAVNLLLKNSLDIESLSTHLGYSEPSAFHRAFKSWFGVTPRKFCQLRHNEFISE